MVEITDVGLVALIILLVYIGLFVGFGIGLIGNLPTVSTDIYSWEAPFIYLVLFSAPAILGYTVGKNTDN